MIIKTTKYGHRYEVPETIDELMGMVGYTTERHMELIGTGVMSLMSQRSKRAHDNSGEPFNSNPFLVGRKRKSTLSAVRAERAAARLAKNISNLSPETRAMLLAQLTGKE